MDVAAVALIFGALAGLVVGYLLATFVCFLGYRIAASNAVQAAHEAQKALNEVLAMANDQEN